MMRRFFALALFAAFAAGVSFAASAAGLPEGYTLIRCITVTDKRQYINTGHKPKLTTDIDAHFAVPGFTASSNPLYWTRIASGTWDAYGFILQTDTKKVRAYRLSQGGGSTVPVTTLKNALTTDIWLSTQYADGGAVNTFTVNGETEPFVKGNANVNYPIYIFRLNDAGAVNVDAVVGNKLYSFNILENGEVVKEFVPCLRAEDNVAGLYDLREQDPAKAFYPNADTNGSGSFGFESMDDEAVLNVMSSHTQIGTPNPAYGLTSPEAGAEIVAEMPQTAIVNYLSGEERELLGWTLTTVSASGETVTKVSTDATRQRCTFTPQKGDNITLTWRWSPDFYGARTLPDDYTADNSFELSQEDAYLRNAFVNTDYIPSLDDQIVLDAELGSAAGTFFLLCARESTENPATAPNLSLFGLNGQTTFSCGTGSRKENLGDFTMNRTTYSVNGRKLYKDGGQIVDFGVTEGDLARPLVLGGSYSAYDATVGRPYNVGNNMMGKFYVLRVWDKNGVPRMDLRPCTRKSDGTTGFYDTVRGVFCPKRYNPVLTVSGDPGNGGTPTPYGYGTTIISIKDKTTASTVTAAYPFGKQSAVGGEATFEAYGWELVKTTAEGVTTVVSNNASHVNSCSFEPYYGDKYSLKWLFDYEYTKPAGPHMPQRYSEVAWMDFPSNTYIVTDYVPHPDKIKMQTKFQLEKRDKIDCVFSARAGVNNACYTLLVYPQEGQGAAGLQFRVNWASANFLSTPPFDTPLTMWSETNTVWIKDVTEKVDVGAFDGKFTQAGGPLVFGATYTIDAAGKLSSFNNFSSMRFFGAKVWEGGALIHNYLPCFERLTGVSGVYDTVEGKFFGNAEKSHFAFGEKKFSGLMLLLR